MMVMLTAVTCTISSGALNEEVLSDGDDSEDACDGGGAGVGDSDGDGDGDAGHLDNILRVSQ